MTGIEPVRDASSIGFVLFFVYLFLLFFVFMFFVSY